MPLPHFLWMLAAVIAAAAVTLCLALSVGVPLQAMALVVLIAAAFLHFASPGDDSRRNPGA